MIKPRSSAVVAALLALATLTPSSPQQLEAQFAPRPGPFEVDLRLGGGLLGDSDVGAAFQPEIGLSYMPGRVGVGLNAGLLNYQGPLDPDLYRAGFEDVTAVSGDDGWRNLFISVGPRIALNAGGPLRIRGSLDLMMIRNQAPDVGVAFSDPDGTLGDAQLQLLDQSASSDLPSWSAALRPDIQLEYGLGPSGRFALTGTVGFQYRMSEAEYGYTQRDLTGVTASPDARETFFALESAPRIESTAFAPRTNVFGSVGVKIRLGGARRSAAQRGVVHRDVACRAAGPQGPAACPAGAPYRCPDGSCSVSQGQCASPSAADAQDYNSSRSNKPRTRTPDGGEDLDPQVARMLQVADVPRTLHHQGRLQGLSQGDGGGDTGDGDEPDEPSEDRGATQVRTFSLEPRSAYLELSTMPMSTNSQQGMRSGAQNHNSSRSNRTQPVANPDIITDDDDGDGFPDFLAEASLQVAAPQGQAQGPDGAGSAIRLELGDPDSDGDGISDLTDASTFSVTQDGPAGVSNPMFETGEAAGEMPDSPTTRGNEGSPLHEEGGVSGESALYEGESAMADDGPTQVWSYALASPRLDGDPDSDEDGYGDVLAGATLRVIQMGGRFHFDVRLAPGADASLLQTGSFSISKRSARTGR